ncbi:SDR family NAD(P)-dependent oxidoreductase [Streptosporangium sp. NPDC048047]|uniref:SDR family NAD(P)-dependent oxidoreductase n=1 Tax=Streptosporangium sp. NPDC048047 TaxID=3155748 RepID=UPI00341BECC7
MALTWSFDDIPDQSGRTTLITGASSGLGLVVADRLARRGASVIMAVRDPAKGERVRAGLRGDIEVRQVDLADLDSVRRFADRMHADGRRIDVLLNNAGIGVRTPAPTPQGYENVFAVNHLGPFALTGLLLELFRPDHDPRVVTVGSNLYRRVRPRTDFEDLTAERPISSGVAYVKSKTANLLFGAELDRRLRRAGSPVRSFLAHPGMASTPMQDKGGLTQKAVLAIVKPLFSRPAEQGALPLAFAATSPEARTGHFLGFSGRRTDPRIHFEALVPPADDPALAERLWRLSEDATGVRYLNGDLAGRP